MPNMSSDMYHDPYQSVSPALSYSHTPLPAVPKARSPYMSIPLPSREQMHDYLILNKGQRDGLRQNYAIDGRLIDPYLLFAQVIQAGGSIEITTRNGWQEIATFIGLISLSTPYHLGNTASLDQGRMVHGFFQTMLGGLEDLWDKTRSGPALAPPPYSQESSLTKQVDHTTMSLQNILEPVPQASTSYGPATNEDRWSRQPFSHSNLQYVQPPYSNAYASSSRSAYTETATWEGSPSYVTARTPATYNLQRPVSTATILSQSPTPTPLNNYTQPVLHQPIPSYPPSSNIPGRLAQQAEAPLSSLIPPKVVKKKVSKPRTKPPSNKTASSSSQITANVSIQPALTTQTSAIRTSPPPTVPLPPVLPNIPSRSSPLQPSQPDILDIPAPPRPPTPIPAGQIPAGIDSFLKLVVSGILPLPKPGKGAKVKKVGYSPLEFYSMRCHELRHQVMQKKNAAEVYRKLTADEITFWNKLVAILDHNRSIVVPGIEEILSSKQATEKKTRKKRQPKNAVPKPPPQSQNEATVLSTPNNGVPPVSAPTSSSQPPVSRISETPGKSSSSANQQARPSVSPAVRFALPASQVSTTSIVTSKTVETPASQSILALDRKIGQGSMASVMQRVVSSTSPAGDLLRKTLQIGSQQVNRLAETPGKKIAKPSSAGQHSKTIAKGKTSVHKASLHKSPAGNPVPRMFHLSSPAMILSASPKKRIHLSTGQPSFAQIPKRDATPIKHVPPSSGSVHSPIGSGILKSTPSTIHTAMPRTVMDGGNALEQLVSAMKQTVHRAAMSMPEDHSRHIERPVRQPVNRAMVVLPLRPLKQAVKVKMKPVNRAIVAIPISKRARAYLIQQGFYDDAPDEGLRRRHAHVTLRPAKIPVSRQGQGRLGRFVRPRDPEDIPQRFLNRPGPSIIEPFKSILEKEAMVKRSSESRCEWKGCDSVLASEWHLAKHVEMRRHALQGKFQSQSWGDDVLYRCHWKNCEEPCFHSEKDLVQHITARHVSRNLKCPFEACELTSPTISHLSRHVMKQHDDPSDEARPIADLSSHLPPPEPVPEEPLPTAARSDELSTPPVQGSIYASAYRREWLRQRIEKNCMAGDDPVMHVTHAPHILQQLEHDEGSVSVPASEQLPAWERDDGLLDQVLGRKKRKMVLSVEIPIRKRSKLGMV